MSEARIGRFVSAALHESVAAHLPFRVEFYEHWLQPPRLRAGTVGMASFLAVLSFLRQEGESYSLIVEDAGRHAAEWMFLDVSALTRARWRWMPRGLRVRKAMRLARRLVTESAPRTRGRIRWQRPQATLQVDNSAFCDVRTHVAMPLCGFYTAAVTRFCELLAVGADVSTASCRAMGAPCCAISVNPALASDEGANGHPSTSRILG
jgi:predicted hydrocarbon binding protein